jgi:hypothetical protein
MVSNRFAFQMCCALVVGLSACQTALPETPRVTTQEDYCPDCSRPQVRKAMTWTAQALNLSPTSPTTTLTASTFTIVGADAMTDANDGDTPIEESAPVLCRYDLNEPITLEGELVVIYAFKATVAIRGDALGSQLNADNLCEADFGTGWQMLEVSTNLIEHGIVGIGELPTNTRFWVAHPTALVNPWNR